MVSTTTPFCLEIALSTVQRGEFREPEFCEHRAGLCSESREGQGLGKHFPPAEPWRTAGLQKVPGQHPAGLPVTIVDSGCLYGSPCERFARVTRDLDDLIHRIGCVYF